MLPALEQARAVAWDAARPADTESEHVLTAAVAGALVPDAFFKCAKDCVQVLGGIGFNVGARRPPVSEAGGRSAGAARRIATRLSSSRDRIGEGGRAPFARGRSSARGRAHRHRSARVPRGSQDPRQRRVARPDADAGFVAPHWPKPWGRDASALEQLVIDHEFQVARVRRPHLAVGAWVAADAHRARHARAAAALDGPDAARRDELVPDVQRARRRERPGVAVDEGQPRRRWLAAHRPEGVDVDGPAGRLGHLPRPTIPRCRSTTASRASSST